MTNSFIPRSRRVNSRTSRPFSKTFAGGCNPLQRIRPASHAMPASGEIRLPAASAATCCQFDLAARRVMGAWWPLRSSKPLSWRLRRGVGSIPSLSANLCVLHLSGYACL